MKNNQKQKSC